MKQVFSDKQIDRLLQTVGPVTHFEDLAEEGHLLEYLNEFLKERYNIDVPFRVEMFNLLLKYSKVPVPEIEEYYLKHLQTALKLFLERTAKWRI
jgi:hypothetical protein